MNLSSIKRKVAEFPQNPGVYFFHGAKGEILYIGKATNLRSRVSSYLRGTETRSHIEAMMPLVFDVSYEQTDSVLEALILESNLIKKYQPKYNVKEKDDKSFSYFVITKEEFPRVLIVRKTDLSEDGKWLKTKKLMQLTKLKAIFGPYTSKKQMEIALKIVRKIFPFHSLRQQSEKGCLDFQLGFCPGPYVDAISKADYQKNIRGIEMILQGKKKSLVSKLEKEMQAFAKKNEFEKAAVLRNKIFALQHIRDVALMTRDFEGSDKKQETRGKGILVTGPMSHVTRVEAYDISNISGMNAVGSMVVFENGQPNKSQYRKFKIKTVEGSNDVAMMREVLLRRFKNDWAMPDLILLDGGLGHANMAGGLVRELGLDVLIVAVAKGKTRKNLNFQFPISNKFSMIQFPKELQEFLNDKNLMKQIMDEAHRFAITFHRKIRRKSALL